jgi:hypothetical protein
VIQVQPAPLDQLDQLALLAKLDAPVQLDLLVALVLLDPLAALASLGKLVAQESLDNQGQPDQVHQLVSLDLLVLLEITEFLELPLD